MKLRIKEKREAISRLLSTGEKGAIRVGYAAAYSFKKAPKSVADDMRRTIPLKYFPIVLSVMISNLKCDVAINKFFECFPEHHELLRGIMLCTEQSHKSNL